MARIARTDLCNTCKQDGHDTCPLGGGLLVLHADHGPAGGCRFTLMDYCSVGTQHVRLYLYHSPPGGIMSESHVQGTIYLLHFDTPFGHAAHYLGWASNLDARLSHHARGTGANLLRHVRNAGIGWQVSRTWSGDRYEERRLKNLGGHARKCPTCQGRAPQYDVTPAPSNLRVPSEARVYQAVHLAA